MSPIHRTARVLTGALISGVMLSGQEVTTPVSADTLGLATCKAHYANTAAWADCTGGTEKSWAGWRSSAGATGSTAAGSG
jgi:hypothetical protein